MDTINTIIGAALRGYFALFQWAHPLVGLAVLSALAGIAMLWAFRLTSNQTAIAAAKRRVYAYLMELRLYADEPLVVWRAQKRLLAANARYLGLMLRPALIIGIPMVLLLVRLDAFYGRAPISLGREAIVTLETRDRLDSRAPAPLLQAPDGVRVETPAVRVLRVNQVSWRIRAERPVSGALRFSLGNGSVEKNIETGSGVRFVPGRRTASALDAIWYGDELRISNPGVAWIDVTYPSSDIELLGLHWHWLVWFTLVSMLTAFALRKRFKVTL